MAEEYNTNYSKHYNLTQTLQFDTNNTACDKHVQIVTNREKDRKQKKNNGDIEALADARRALNNVFSKSFQNPFYYVHGV